MHWIYLIYKFHNLSWITEINELFHNILIYWDAPVHYFSLYVNSIFLASDVLFNVCLNICNYNQIYLKIEPQFVQYTTKICNFMFSFSTLQYWKRGQSHHF